MKLTVQQYRLLVRVSYGQRYGHAKTAASLIALGLIWRDHSRKLFVTDAGRERI